ncbi:unnamed protein product [Cercopithifilaria johnstoni]|uniref:Uncharacterized protein n=1 Tax=Cercopithifilaria johnstoni TaxID=2874296 RepID=A0A8J2QB22_9BILA|nr:unnamed protein product [Cercopithifilaria johnstoni]
MSAAYTTPSPQHLQNWSIERCGNGPEKLQKNSINSNTLNRHMRFNAINDNVEESKDLILYNSQSLSFPVIPQLWYTPQPFIPYYFTSSPPQYSPFIPYLSYYSNATPKIRQQKYQSKKMCKSSKTHFWCAGIAQLLWTIVVIIAVGLLAILILALFIV